MPGVFRFDGGKWVNYNDSNKIYRFNGSSWVQGRGNGGLTVRLADGRGGFNQIYPSPVVAGSKTVKPANSGLRNYKTGQSPNWQNDGDARQGYYNWRSPHSRYSGWLGIRRGNFGVSGLQSVDSASLTAKRNGSGYYNSNQTITFYGSSLTSASGDPFASTRNGAFTCTTGGPGKNGTMYNRAISGLGEVRNWLNGANGADGLIILNGETSGSSYSSNYLGISNIELSISYTATGYSVRFEPAPEASTFSRSRMPGVEMVMIDGTPYLIYLVKEDEMNLTYEQIMNKRETNLEVTPTLSQAKLEGMVFDPEIISAKVITKEDGPYLEVMVMNVDDKKVQVYSPRDGWINLNQRITAEGPNEFVFETKLNLDTDIFDGGDPKIRVSY